MKKILVLLILTGFTFYSGIAQPARDYYELKIYRITGKVQEEKVDNYLKAAFIPAVHRAGISKVGVFKPVETDTTTFGKIVYVFIPYKSVDQYIKLQETLAGDKKYQEDGKLFLDAPYTEPPFRRLENVLMVAFKNMPQFRAPSYTTAPAERIYELRSYESATEFKASQKRKMFNEGGEIALFEKLGFNAAFYGEVLIGSTRPNLMYMTTFETLKSREDHWNAFRVHPDWKVMSGLEEYKNTVSKNNTLLLHPTDYSDF